MAKPFSLAFEGAAFGAFLNEMADEVAEEQIPRFLRTTMVDLLASVIKKTPVDTGRARGGWIPYLREQGAPVDRLLEDTSEVSTESADINANDVADGESVSGFTDDIDGLGQFVEVINAVHYIVQLEFGSSSQAPAGMVRITMREFQAKADLGEGMLDALENIFTSANIRARTRGRELPS